MTRRTAQTTQTADTAQDAQVTQEVQEGQTTQEPQEGQDGQTAETPQIDPEVLQAYLASQGLELRKKGERKPRVERMTQKQGAFIRALQSVPEGEEQNVADLALSAGATATSHGFVFRMLEHGYLELRVTDKGIAMLPDAESEESDESEESTESDESVESPESE